MTTILGSLNTVILPWGKLKGKLMKRHMVNPLMILDRTIADARRDCESKKERLKLERMLEDHNKLLYPNCEDGKKKLGTTLELLQ